MFMKRIKLEDYDEKMGVLIDVQHPEDYYLHPLAAINIYADKLLIDYKRYLDPSKKYYIICNKGYLSRKVVAYLEYIGYNVTQVVKKQD